MVQESDMQPIPEELYNLTQLAEVTLAAGRLSTTNVNVITEYINKEKNKCSNNTQKNNEFLDRRKSKFRKKFVSGSECIQISENIYNKYNLSDELHHSTIITSDNSNTNDNNKEKSNNIEHSFLSSDDDSNYYSHKVFDRKKSRRYMILDNGQYDEHSCSSVLSSGDEHYIAYSSLKQTSGNHFVPLEDDHICPECGKKYSTSSNLARHRQTHRSILDKKARRCPHCEKVYVSMPAYSMHVRTHSQGCECPHCGKCFSRPWLLQGHIRTHTGEKPFKCSICSKAFADKSNLRAHIQTHSNIKPHACRRCGKAFALKSYLYKHEESSCMRSLSRSDKDCIKSSKIDSKKANTDSKILRKELHCAPSKIINWNSSETLQSNQEENMEKPYTTLTSSMTQNNFDRFTRISVIRPPISNQNFESSSFEMNFYQENPVDFSPRNNFSHSSMTIPFEMNSSYTLVA